ncbi:unnamed protein product [Paramecium sonneborni]|uniref:Peptidase C51 domain-containing protein n=1 Tax=Paramecium sonneborni TaxID=65129 RepID=A0A8S1LBI4_9CILI|nr:unnamed protein product [Paramecium sonneborni]
MKFIVLILLLLFVFNQAQVQITPRIQCKTKKCEGDNFCFQGYCTSCEGPRSLWNKRKPLWGTKVGEALQVPAFSNFGDLDVLDSSKDEFLEDSINNFGEEIYIGQKYQCVHYARKFWIQNFNVTFGSVDNAEQIFDLQEAYNINSKQNINLQKFQNGGIETPILGDLLIWQKDDGEFPYGHVAVVLNVDLESDYPHVLIAEQNYDQIWDTRNFSRALKITLGEKKEINISNNRQTFPTKDDLKCRDDLYTSQGVILGWIRLKIQ